MPLPAVTQFCIDSAIGKLGRVEAQVQEGRLRPLLRGMRKPMDPQPGDDGGGSKRPGVGLLFGILA